MASRTKQAKKAAAESRKASARTENEKAKLAITPESDGIEEEDVDETETETETEMTSETTTQAATGETKKRKGDPTYFNGPARDQLLKRVAGNKKRINDFHDRLGRWSFAENNDALQGHVKDIQKNLSKALALFDEIGETAMEFGEQKPTLRSVGGGTRAAVELVVGAVVALREKRREDFQTDEAFADADLDKMEVTWVAPSGKEVKVKLSNGNVERVPRADLKVVSAAA